MPIDVVIPLYEGGRWIEETLASVFAQGDMLGEVVVVDDASTDDGPERVRALGELGPCPEHRRSFAPVRACLGNGVRVPVPGRFEDMG